MKVYPLPLGGGFMKVQRQIIQEEKLTGLQREDILYLSGRRMVDEKKLSQELFKVDFYDLTYSQAEQVLEHLRALSQPNVGHSHTCFSCESEFTCICISYGGPQNQDKNPTTFKVDFSPFIGVGKSRCCFSIQYP